MVRLFVSDRIFIDEDLCNGGIVVNNDGKIEEVFKDPIEVEEWLDANSHTELYDYTNLVIMPGLIDTHVHINEPGRTAWEGFETATKAAAAGGFTSLIDMPLNSIPPTTTVENLLKKQKATIGKICTDVGFWGGLVPGNENELKKLLQAGVVGFKCFLCPLSDEYFNSVTEAEVELAMKHLENTNALVAFHAEKCDDECCDVDENNGDIHDFKTYLKTRPASLELNAIEMITRVAQKYNSVRMHIVHLSSADALPLIKKCREIVGNRLTVETCHHYLNFTADDIPQKGVEFKCCPPIRDANNQKQLWNALKSRDINMVVSDHSPCPPELKFLTDGPDFGNMMKSFCGISSVQFGLSVFWTSCEKHNMDISDMVHLMSVEPAKMCGFENRKSKLAKGYDADMCIWDPSGEFVVTPDIVHFRHKANPYMGKKLKGLVHATIVRGNFAYRRSDREIFNFVGQMLLK
ncbi:uncharacterized protein LOC116338156 [Contarinia nasturtii]|uniref:uncharacterized protein LOC116338156 n=1 Tax=Contarinia nasturtii TaxID=265458 RepID=UPI0012D41393|nr:uncharacterized protein LOC116338156 [Contarinia nasturtii]